MLGNEHFEAQKNICFINRIQIIFALYILNAIISQIAWCTLVFHRFSGEGNYLLSS